MYIYSTFKWQARCLSLLFCITNARTNMRNRKEALPAANTNMQTQLHKILHINTHTEIFQRHPMP